MLKIGPLTPRFTLIVGFLLLAVSAARGQIVESAKAKFIFKDADGTTDSAEIVTKYIPKKIVHPLAKADRSIDPKLTRAATIAEERAHAHSREQCWHYVKEALVASGAVNSYPKTVYAKEAAKELVG